MKPASKKSFWALIITQFFGAYNDNVLKTLVTLLIVAWVEDTRSRNSLVSISGVVFVAPFLIFSMIAGRLSDRLGKPAVIRGTKFWELLVIAAAIASLWEESIPWMMVTLFMLSMQATFFSPAKYGVLPEMMGESELPVANAYLNLSTFAAILLGTLTAGFLSERINWACASMAMASVLGLVASFFMTPLPAAKPEESFEQKPAWLAGGMGLLVAAVLLWALHHTPWKGWELVGFAVAVLVSLICFSIGNAPDLLENWKIIRKDRALKLGTIAVNYFWLMGAILQLNIFLYAKEMMDVSDQMASLMVMAVAIGVGFGSYWCAKLSRGKVELGLMPLGAFGMSIFAMDLLWAHHSLVRAFFDFFMLGIAGGFYDIPLMALIQWRSPQAERGRVMATVNFLSFVAILGASALLWLLSNPLQHNPAQVFFTLGWVSMVGTIIVAAFVPDALLRFVLYALTNTFYRIRIIGEDNIPVNGPALLVANHLSLVDGFLVGSSVPYPVRFLIWRPYYEAKAFHWFLKRMNAIPVSETDSPKEVLRSLSVARKALEAGEVVCLFAEGQVSRTGNLLEFKRGFEVIVKGLDVPIIPVHLDRVWGSIFSFEHNRVIYKKPRRIPYPVTVTFGKSMPSPQPASAVRQAVLDLSTEAFDLRLEERSSLPLEFLKCAKKQPQVLAVADSSGKELSYGRLAAVSHVTANLLAKMLPESETVGVMLPASVGAAVANIALSLLGRVPVNLNYTAGEGCIQAAVQKAGIARILTSRKLLEKTGLSATSMMIYIEDLISLVSKTRVAFEYALFCILPTSMAIKRFGARAEAPLSQRATIMFSSGSTGDPKGVVLTHANILSNILGLSQVFDVGKNDRIIGVLPFFHSFGFTGTLWFPLLTGFSAVYHTNPLDAKTVGEITEKYHATLLLATPTFLMAYTRKCTPEQFRSLRFVITGAERLRETIAKEFETKFGKIPLEGYGCTELSPVATVNVPNVSMGEINQVGHKPGKIGHPIPGVSVKIVDPESFAPLPQGEQGLLLVKGPNVMEGYLGEPAKTREAIRDGWYVTGDLAMVDNDGFVQIMDRLSRFSKIGGEMVPHVMLEEKLQQLIGRSEPLFAVTSVPDEKRGEQLVVLFVNPGTLAGETDSSIDLNDVYKRLQDAGLPKLWIPARENFFPIEAIPYLGTGKLDLSKIRDVARKNKGM